MNVVDRYDEVRLLADEVRRLRGAMLAAEFAQQDSIERVHPRHRRSATNLVHYVELRGHDIRQLQGRLSAIGLSSLGRSEPHVLAAVDAVLDVLETLAGATGSDNDCAALSIGEGDFLLASNAVDLLGPQAPGRVSRIMVTLPSEAAHEPDLVDSLIDAGMDVARINCAHDGPDEWLQMITHLRADPDEESPPIAMDLAGPKLRTGPLGPGPAVVRARPERDPFGKVTSPATIWLTGASERTETATDEESILSPAADVPVQMSVSDESWLHRRLPGDMVELIDARGSRRHWTVDTTSGDGCLLSCPKTTYFANGLELTCSDDRSDDVALVTGIAPSDRSVRVMTGDRIVLTRDLGPVPPIPTSSGDDARRGATVTVGCTLPELFDAALPGEPIWFDDGKIGGIIEHVQHDRVDVEVTDVRPGGVRLKSGKGINVPDTHLPIEALTARDLVDLDFVAAHADIVNLSFVREAADVRHLLQELTARDATHIGVVLKIENVRAFENLPQLLLAAMQTERVGVMIARGDLAVEVGFERLAEVQEEIMWACEAAHVPVIWATQVLESMARTGRPSRAEVTDAAMSVHAECVMLNKGPHILEAIAALDSILSRMGEHHLKKRSMLRRLRSWTLPESI